MAVIRGASRSAQRDERRPPALPGVALIAAASIALGGAFVASGCGSDSSKGGDAPATSAGEQTIPGQTPEDQTPAQAPADQTQDQTPDQSPPDQSPPDQSPPDQSPPDQSPPDQTPTTTDESPDQTPPVGATDQTPPVGSEDETATDDSGG